MPISPSFRSRLYPVLEQVAAHFNTPFHIYDEAGIRATGAEFVQTFSKVKAFKEYFAVKALPNPVIMAMMKDMGFGFDCSSIPELLLSRRVGSFGEEIMFTSNNTTPREFKAALMDGGSILNLDDIRLMNKLPKMPELICFRYNPGPSREGTDTIGKPVEAKYGITEPQLFQAYKRAKENGAKRFGLHTMLISNELNYEYMEETTEMLVDLAERIEDEIGVRFEFINIGGGTGHSLPARGQAP